ncbi:MAG: hypothetical protein ACRDGM_20290, partial [bacterium]
MSRPRFVVIFLLAAFLPSHTAKVAAYELRTHGEITRKAFDASFAVRAYLEDVGLSPGDTFDLGRVTSSLQLRGFENSGTLQDWMIEGAIREDDFRPHPGCPQPG